MKLFTVRYASIHETTVLADNSADAAVRIVELAQSRPTKVIAVWDCDSLPPEMNSIKWAERMFKKRWG